VHVEIILIFSYNILKKEHIDYMDEIFKEILEDIYQISKRNIW